MIPAGGGREAKMGKGESNIKFCNGLIMGWGRQLDQLLRAREAKLVKYNPTLTYAIPLSFEKSPSRCDTLPKNC